jgi:transposase
LASLALTLTLASLTLAGSVAIFCATQLKDPPMTLSLSRLTGITHPWKFIGESLDDDKMECELELTYDGKSAPCPECGVICPFHDRSAPQRWHHLSMCLYKTLVTCRLPRTKCPLHGVKTIAPEWAAPRGNFTLAFESMVIQWLLIGKKQEGVAKMMGISDDRVRTIMTSAVERGLLVRPEPQPEHLATDEKGYGKGHKYMTVFSDGGTGTVIDVIDGRDAETTQKGLEKIVKPKYLKLVKICSIDMSKSFFKALRAACPNAKICFDRFHVSMHISKAIGNARRQGVRELGAAGDEEGVKALKGTLNALRRNPETRSAKDDEKFEAAMAASTTVATVWRHGEVLRKFWDKTPNKKADGFLRKWANSAINSDIACLRRVGKLVDSHFQGILDAKLEGKTNAIAESLNSKIQEVRTIARGFKSFDRYRFNTLFYCGGLQLLPQKTR